MNPHPNPLIPSAHSFRSLLDNAGTMCDDCYGGVDDPQHMKYDIVASYPRPVLLCPRCAWPITLSSNARGRKVSPHSRIRTAGDPIDFFEAAGHIRCELSGMTYDDAIVAEKTRRDL